MDQDDVGVGELLRVRVARGDFGVRPVSDGADETSERGAPRTRSAGDGTSAARKTARATTRATTSRRTAATRSATEAVVKEGVKQAARKPTAKQVGRPARKTTGSAPAGSAEALPLDPQESPGGDGGDGGDVTRRS
jgi:exodeoxyribonuclease VII large subunit